MKLWMKNSIPPLGDVSKIEQFTAGKDHEFDLLLAPFDVLGSIAHAKMLASVELLTNKESHVLVKELKGIYKDIQQSIFLIRPDVEDVHSQIEFILTEKLGDVRKKIHSARSRNDQVLLDIKMFLRSEIEKTVNAVRSFFELLIAQSEKY